MVLLRQASAWGEAWDGNAFNNRNATANSSFFMITASIP
ncbi:hypothetical protein AM1_H0105 (plasmid) [Acaryochloris marina MBIC11017]|uniref:Uncharacterized protein n=1 Tax=Acaryochloris marina (strain MBIC 11017) TaxID=329726 RepID=A8ZR20_ACAM1|nr:hypothetical protein AM1_H0105 [Acaryochloris marina MBIC11017]